MAFEDLREIAKKLKIKNIGYYNLGDPKARRDRCWSPWCGNWVEDMKDSNRCHEPKCDRRLWEEAIKQKMAIFDANTNTHFGDVSGLLIEPTFDVPPEYIPYDMRDDIMMCKACKKDVKRPNSEVCVTCHLAGKSEQFNKRRTKTRAHKGITNRIKGLDKFRK